MTRANPPLSSDTPVPALLRQSVERHRVNLARLVESLRIAGMDDATIEASVTGIVESYRQELVHVMKALACDAAPPNAAHHDAPHHGAPHHGAPRQHDPGAPP